MKIRTSIIWFCVLLIAGTFFIIWLAKRKPAELQSTASIWTNVVPVALSKPNQSVITFAPPPPPHISATSTNAVRPIIGGETERAIGILSTYNDIPIDFYGQLEDQFGNPVSDARITFNVRIFNGQESDVKRGQIFSDGKGLFKIVGYRGQDLGFMPTKEGYALATTETLYKYSHMEDHPYVSDPSHPTLIKMWKLEGAEPLIGINQSYKIPYVNTPIHFDLLTGKIVSDGGDIQLTVNRSPGIISGRNKVDWGVQIAAVNGGLMDSGGNEAVTYAAPVSGYSPEMAFLFSTNPPAVWFEEFNQGFFLMSRNGQVYSKLGLSFRINENPDGLMYVRFSGVANANGSRNWEADGNTMKSIDQ